MAPVSTSPCELSTVQSSAFCGAVITLPACHPSFLSSSMARSRQGASHTQSSTHQVSVAQDAVKPWRFNNSQVCGIPTFKMKKLEKGTDKDLASTVHQTPFLSLDLHKMTVT